MSHLTRLCERCYRPGELTEDHAGFVRLGYVRLVCQGCLTVSQLDAQTPRVDRELFTTTTTTDKGLQRRKGYVEGDAYLEEAPELAKKNGRGDVPKVAGHFDAQGPTFSMLLDHRAGELEPDFQVPLGLHRLAPQAHTLRSLGEAVSIVMGFSLTLGETDAVAISCRLAAWLIGLDPLTQFRRGSQLLHRLETAGIIRQDGAMDPIDQRRPGTRCFQPAEYDLAALWSGQHLHVVPDEQALAG